eukprot:TRINITY_DN44871_c0_g1_i1.p1 TRINITY_DN44871_c0_g1~~TRINITY_DN44871_c0_g1_i1.p1  ORF type:complete len:309 (+),score=47.17 TRINITY_DN44871_c0_g1_i1:166-1092(+)
MAFPQEVQLFEVCGVPVYVHLMLIVYFVFTLSQAEEELQAETHQKGTLPDYGKAGFVALGCTLGFFVLLLTVLIHELGHCAGAKLVGGRAQKILLWPLGGLAFCGSGGGPGADLVVATMGPLTHLPQYAIWRGLHDAAVASSAGNGKFGPMLVNLCSAAMTMQILLFCFNVFVPVYPLDCSRIIIALLCLGGVPVRVAAGGMCLLSCVVIVLLIASMMGKLVIPNVAVGYHPTMALLVLWLSYQTYQLYAHISKDRVEAHPLFRGLDERLADATAEERQPLAAGQERRADEQQDDAARTQAPIAEAGA